MRLAFRWVPTLLFRLGREQGSAMCLLFRWAPPSHCAPPTLTLCSTLFTRPRSRDGLKVALLNAERYAERAVQRRVASGRVKVPERWEQEAREMAQAQDVARTPSGGLACCLCVRCLVEA